MFFAISPFASIAGPYFSISFIMSSGISVDIATDLVLIFARSHTCLGSPVRLNFSLCNELRSIFSTMCSM